MGGPSVSLTDAPFSTRRSVYGFIERQNLPAFFRTFDFANPNTHTPERPQTTAPQQALFLMNSPFAIEQAMLPGRAQRAARVAGVEPTGEPPDAAATARRVPRPPHQPPVPLRARPRADDRRTDRRARIRRSRRAGRSRRDRTISWPGNSAGARMTKRRARCNFSRCRSFIGSAWQGGAKLPDPTLGWVMLNATGGHPGDAAHSGDSPLDRAGRRHAAHRRRARASQPSRATASAAASSPAAPASSARGKCFTARQ